MHLFVCDHVLKVCEHDVLQTARGNFAKFTTEMQVWTEMNWVDFEVVGSEIKVRTRSSMIKKLLVQRSTFVQK